MILIDTHAHVNFNAYKLDADEVIRRSLDNNTWIINVGSQYTTSKKAVELAKEHQEGIYAAVGLHPIHARDGLTYGKFKQLAQPFNVKAIGEIGLDYKEEYVSFKEKQKEIFFKQLDLAKELKLPVIFHCRMAHEDLIAIIRESKERLRGVVHCFTGNWKQAEQYLAMGLYLGFNGIIFKMNLDDIVKKVPPERILIETDCPYLTPPSQKGRNEPIYVKYVAEKIARLKNITFEETIQITAENAKNLFGL